MPGRGQPESTRRPSIRALSRELSGGTGPRQRCNPLSGERTPSRWPSGDDQRVGDRPNRTEAIEKINSAARRHPSADGSSANTTSISSTKLLGKSSLSTSLGAKSSIVVGFEKKDAKETVCYIYRNNITIYHRWGIAKGTSTRRRRREPQN